MLLHKSHSSLQITQLSSLSKINNHPPFLASLCFSPTPALSLAFPSPRDHSTTACKNHRFVVPSPPMGNPPELYHRILNIPRETSPQEIRAAYKNLVRKWHPDKHPPSSKPRPRRASRPSPRPTRRSWTSRRTGRCSGCATTAGPERGTRLTTTVAAVRT
ncbi:hypothetical protein GUJ93_ZPchr0001g32984 [Zizania palustris]|uniref:J domain-containing protein n=1 Tax=Zizania palustris TaxID=103762 RepID=A0A8J5VP36_ZIZPA|nr:hypothetical protein GUJ93_ZPchr0001g32984 [Zizania palustris]